MRIPRPDGFDPARLPEYHRLLRDVVFPLVDHLKAEGLIEGYDFLTHSHLDLRLWISEGVELDDIGRALAARGLPSDLEEFAPAETGEDRELLLDILRRNSEQVRALLGDSSNQRTLEEVVHWLLNQYGFTNPREIEWYVEQASAWLQTLGAQTNAAGRTGKGK